MWVYKRVWYINCILLCIGVQHCRSPNNAINCYERFHIHTRAIWQPLTRAGHRVGRFSFYYPYFPSCFYCLQSEHVLLLRHCYHIHTRSHAHARTHRHTHTLSRTHLRAHDTVIYMFHNELTHASLCKQIITGVQNGEYTWSTYFYPFGLWHEDIITNKRFYRQ